MLCLSDIEQEGLQLDAYHQCLKPTVFFFDPKDEIENETHFKSVGCRLFIPLIFNYKGIDALMINKEGDKSVTIIPIQITIAKNHSDSVQAFKDHWESLQNVFEKCDSIAIEFLWLGLKKKDPIPDEDIPEMLIYHKTISSLSLFLEKLMDELKLVPRESVAKAKRKQYTKLKSRNVPRKRGRPRK